MNLTTNSKVTGKHLSCPECAGTGYVSGWSMTKYHDGETMDLSVYPSGHLWVCPHCDGHGALVICAIDQDQENKLVAMPCLFSKSSLAYRRDDGDDKKKIIISNR